MIQETKNCEKCKNDFAVLADDVPFYEKMDLPLPTMCPECRFKYLLAFWVNGRFRITSSALSGKRIITVIPESVAFPIYEHAEFISDAWDPLTFGKDYDATKPFLDQLVELQSKVPHPHQVGAKNLNCEWADDVWESKDAYLSRSLKGENIIYGYRVINCKNSIDITFSFDLERCYDCLNCFKSYNLKYSFNSRDSIDSFFLYDCRNCQNCFMCWNLRNQNYCIKNQQYSKEEYLEKIKEFNLKSRAIVDELKKEFWWHIQNDAFHRQNYNVQTVNSTGNFLENDKNCHQGYFLQESENCRYYMRGYHIKETIDSVGCQEAEKCAMCVMDQIRPYDNVCNLYTTVCRYSAYLDNCEECEYCFGCVGMRKKRYCILNKQYTKEEYETLVEKIKNDMKGRGEWGKFWPLSSAYCGYNLSLAHMMFPMTKEQATSFGAKWDEPAEPHYENIISADSLPDNIDDAKDEITKQRILCPETKLSYNVTKDELAFYREHGIPLPRRHFDWRTLERFKPFSMMVNLQKGTCCFCNKEIEHYYSPELGFAKIACLECYQQNVV